MQYYVRFFIQQQCIPIAAAKREFVCKQRVTGGLLLAALVEDTEWCYTQIPAFRNSIITHDYFTWKNLGTN